MAMKRKTAVPALLAAALALQPVAADAAAPLITDIREFSDYGTDLGGGVLQGHWAEKSTDIQTLIAHDGIAGLADGSGGYKFEPDRSISTAELLSILLTTSGNDPIPGNWPVNVMNKGIETGLIPSSMAGEGNAAITREKMALVLVNAAAKLRGETVSGVTCESRKIGDLSKADRAYRPYIQTAYGLGLLAGTGSGYKPKENTTRAEACAIVNRLFGYRPRIDNSTKERTSQVAPATPAKPATPAVPGSSGQQNSGETGSGNAQKRPFFPERSTIFI